MCFDVDSTPPVPAITGGSVAHADVTLEAADGNRFAAFSATTGSAAAIVILPDVRGLYRFYEELALRFAEHGYDAIAIDYFGRTAGVAKRPADWDFWPEVEATTLAGITADTRAAIDKLRSDDADRSVFVVGFCFGGSNSWHMAAADLDISGAVGFYGHPDRPGFPKDAPSVMSQIDAFSCPVLALQGGADPGIPVAVDDRFRAAMEAAGAPGEVIVYDDAPHSFFDRKQEDHLAESTDAWERIQAFLAVNT